MAIFGKGVDGVVVFPVALVNNFQGRTATTLSSGTPSFLSLMALMCRGVRGGLRRLCSVLAASSRLFGRAWTHLPTHLSCFATPRSPPRPCTPHHMSHLRGLDSYVLSVLSLCFPRLVRAAFALSTTSLLAEPRVTLLLLELPAVLLLMAASFLVIYWYSPLSLFVSSLLCSPRLQDPETP